MSQYFYIRNLSSGQAITVDDNSHHYVVLRSLATGSASEKQQWQIDEDGRIKSKATSSDGQAYCLTMNKSNDDTHILALKEGSKDVTKDKSVFELVRDGSIRNVHFGYAMQKVSVDRHEVDHDTIKVYRRSSSAASDPTYRWVWIPIDHEYGLTVLTRPTTEGGLLAGTVDGALSTSYLRLYVYRRHGSEPWTRVGDPITPRPNGSWAVNVTGASQYGLMLVVGDVKPKSTFDSFPTKVGGDLLAVHQVSAPAPTVRYAAESDGRAPVVTLSEWPFEFMGGRDFTVEMWVRLTAPSALFGTKPTIEGQPGWDGVLLGVADVSGRIVFGISDQYAEGYPAARFESRPTLVGDGGWHHVAAMRMGDSLAVFLDGSLLEGTLSAFNGRTGEAAPRSQVERITITNQQFATLGGAFDMPPGGDLGAAPYSVADFGFHGAIDDARVWSKALTPAEIRRGMYSPVDPAAAALLGQWTFDRQDGQNSSAGKSYLTSVGAGVTYTRQNVVQQVPAKQPYLTAQCKLMDDYPDPKSRTTVATYHTVLSVCDASGNRMPNATIYLKADRSCSIRVPQGTGTDGKNLSTTLRQFTTNHAGEFVFSYAAGDSLTAPTFAVQTDFMASDEWLLIFPDRHAHHSLATLTGDALLSRRPDSNLTRRLKGKGVDKGAADALASAVNNLMASALEHDVQAGYPMIRLADEEVGDLFKPVPRLYQNTASARVAYDPQSDVAALHYTGGGDSATAQRIASGDAMPVKHWQYEGDAFSVISASQVQARVTSSKKAPVFLNTAAAVNQAMIDSGKTRFTRQEVAALVQLHGTQAQAAAKKYSVSDLWDDIKRAASVVVSVAEYVIEGAADVLRVVSVWMDDVKNYVLETVEDAVSAVGGLFAKFEVAAQDIIDFVKATFDWGDILQTQAVLKRYLTQAVPGIRAQARRLEASVVGGLDTLKHTVDSYLGKAIEELGDKTLGDAQARVTSNAPQDVQSAYLQRQTLTYMTDESVSLPIATTSGNGQSTFDDIINRLVEEVSDDVATFKTVIADTPSFTTLLSDPQAFFKAGVKDIISAVQLLWDVALDVLKAGVEGVFAAFDAILTAIDALMSTRIVIPFVTDLYEHVIHPGGVLTMYDLLALFGAAPLTITYKVLHGGKLPFDAQSGAVQSFMKVPGEQYPEYLAKAKSVPSDQKIVLAVSWGLGFTASAAIGTWAICNAASDIPIVGKFFQTVGVLCEFTVFACSAPIYFVLGTDPLSIFNATVWGTFAIPLVISAGELFRPKPTPVGDLPPPPNPWDALVKPGINVALGVIHTLSFIAAGTWETVNISQSGSGGAAIGLGVTNAWLKTTLNIVSVVPELDKALMFHPASAKAVPVTDALFFSLWASGTAALTSMDAGFNLETVIR